MILSVPEGDDKPLKYPNAFQVVQAVVLNKIDTKPVFNFDEEAFDRSVDQLNPTASHLPHFRHAWRWCGGVDGLAGKRNPRNPVAKLRRYRHFA